MAVPPDAGSGPCGVMRAVPGPCASVVVLVHRVAEEGIRLGERAAAEDDLRPAAGDSVQGGEALEDAHRVVGAEHGHGRAEPDALRLPGDGRQHHLGRGDGEVVAVVLADAEEIEPQLVGEHGLGDDVAQHLRVGQEPLLRVPGHVAERIDAELEMCCHRDVPFGLELNCNPKKWGYFGWSA